MTFGAVVLLLRRLLFTNRFVDLLGDRKRIDGRVDLRDLLDDLGRQLVGQRLHQRPLVLHVIHEEVLASPRTDRCAHQRADLLLGRVRLLEFLLDHASGVGLVDHPEVVSGAGKALAHLALHIGVFDHVVQRADRTFRVLREAREVAVQQMTDFVIDEALHGGKKLIRRVVRDEGDTDKTRHMRLGVVLDVCGRAGLSHGDVAFGKDLHDTLDGLPKDCYAIGCHFVLLCNQHLISTD